jgi:RNA polymerase sigma-70 factor (ECF subfamily)
MDQSPEGASAAACVTRESVWKEYVGRCSHQGASAVGKLYDERSSLVYSLVLRILGNEADAEEVTLDTYTQVWRIARTYDPSRGNVTAWIVKIGRSRALDRLRARATRAQMVERIPEFVEIPASDFTPEEGTIPGMIKLRELLGDYR